MKKVTVTVAIPAYNEAENIESLLVSIFAQKTSNFVLSEVIVYTDGSTDQTPVIVNNLQKKFVKLVLKKAASNKGKLFRLNQIFKENISDILIVLDADIALDGQNFLEQLVRAMITNKSAKIVAAHSELVLPKNIIGKIVASSFLTWDYVRMAIPGMDSIHNFSSQATAYRGSFARKLHIPASALEERIYIYLMAKKENPGGFVYAKNAKVKFLPPSSIEDLVLMTRRPFGKKQEEIDNMFGFDTEGLLVVPKKYKIQGILSALVQQPILTPTGLLLNFIIPKLSMRNKKNVSSKWERSSSTKGRIVS